jgi:hypothetical protein
MTVGPDDIPVFVQAGGVLALLPDEVRSLSPYAPAVPDHRELLAVPGPAGQAWAGSLGPGLTGRAHTGADNWALALHADRPTSWRLTLPVPAAPASVEGVADWSFAKGLLTCTLTGESASVQVHGG